MSLRSFLAAVLLVAGGRPALADPPIPAHGRCTGRWTAKLAYEVTKTCDEARLAPWRDLEVTISLGAKGYEGQATKPAGRVEVTGYVWNFDGEGSCEAQFRVILPDNRRAFVMLHDGPLEASAQTESSDKGMFCNSKEGTATLTPDTSGLPPPDPAAVALTGTYTLDIDWRPDRRCPKDMPRPPKQTELTATVDRGHTDDVKALGALPGLSDEKAWIFGSREGWLFATRKGMLEGKDAEWQLDARFRVKGGKLEGTASFFIHGSDAEAPDICTMKGKVRGTRKTD